MFCGLQIKSNVKSTNLKLCCDFYAISTTQEAKDMLLGSISLPETDKRKTTRRTTVAKTNMQDIITIFYEMKPREMSVFVTKNLNNLPPLSMDNFDMAHIIETMSDIQSKMLILQEAQEKSLSVHAALCNDVSERAQPTEIPPAPAGGTKPEAIKLQQEVTSGAPKSPPVVFNITANSIDHGMDGNDDDLINLARIQGELSPAVSPRRPSSQTDEPHLLNDSIMSNTSYASLVRNGQLNTDHAHDRKKFRHVTNRRNRNKNNIAHKSGNLNVRKR